MSNFHEQLAEKIENFEDYLSQIIKIDGGHQQKIIDAMEYSLLNGGKRIRAMLLLGFYEAFSENCEKAYPFASAIEMIHAYSLIHDDLPCMDNDDFRRGKPSSHKVFGEAIAVLAGDSLLNFAFETISQQTYEFSDRIIIRAMADLSKSSGYMGMIGGQVIDIENEGKTIDGNLLSYMHSLKTGALIRTACRIGAIIAGADEKQVKIADRYGECVGFAFQIQDDIFDVEGDVAVLGKPIGSDKENQKTTYVTIYGIEQAKEKYIKMYEEAINCLFEIKGNTEFLINLTNMLKNRKY
ncbi:MAG: polyprenyl synthetase family protein [Oscillospiraceae bacterium]